MRRVFQLGLSCERLVVLRHDIRSARHTLDAASHDQIGIAVADGPGPNNDGLQTRSAQAVHSDARHFRWKPGKEQCHTRDIAIVFACLVRTPVDHITEPLPVDGRVAFDERAERQRSEIVGANTGQRAGITPEGRPDPVADESVGHKPS